MRRRTPDALPELTQLELRDRGDKSASLEALLKEVAEQNRNGALQLFYSIRAVAGQFNLPQATVSRIYRRLSSERVLRMVWGSRTLLEPRPHSENGYCRSIGIPVNVSRFRASINYRESVRALQLELWNHGVEERLLFFERREDEIVDLCTRSHHPNVDSILWLMPERSYKPTILRLRDLGVRVFCLAEDAIPELPECHTISARCSVGAILRKEVLRV